MAVRLFHMTKNGQPSPDPYPRVGPPARPLSSFSDILPNAALAPYWPQTCCNTAHFSVASSPVRSFPARCPPAKPRKYLHTLSVGQRGYCTIPPLTGQRGYVRPGGRWAGHTPSDLSKGVGYTPSALPIRYEKYTIILSRLDRGSMEK